MCFHNPCQPKPSKLPPIHGRQSDVVEICQSILDEQYHVECVYFPQISYHYFFGRSTGFQLGTHPFLGKKRRGMRQK